MPGLLPPLRPHRSPRFASLRFASLLTPYPLNPAPPGYPFARRVALLVQLQQPIEDRAPCPFADGVAQSLLRLVEAVPQFEVALAVGRSDGVVHGNVEAPQFADVCAALAAVVEAIVDLREPLPASFLASLCQASTLPLFPSLC